LSLSEPLREDGDAELGDVVEDRSAESPLEVAATSLLPQEIAKLLGPLDEREREILRLRFGLDRGEPRTLEEVGEHFNLTRERIRQIEARAMSKLRPIPVHATCSLCNEFLFERVSPAQLAGLFLLLRRYRYVVPFLSHTLFILMR
jgi:DNA-directed RNA polymerase sigma subunit (sigma70/sigma32)